MLTTTKKFAFFIPTYGYLISDKKRLTKKEIAAFKKEIMAQQYASMPTWIKQP